jgi:DNA-binding MarR family transcriptional regulator
MPIRDVPPAAATLRRVLASFPPDIAFKHIHILLMVAEQGDPQMREVEYAMGIPQPTLSRLVAELGRFVRKDVEGFNLVETYADPENRRNKRIRLTPNGHKLMYRVVEDIKSFDQRVAA